MINFLAMITNRLSPTTENNIPLVEGIQNFETMNGFQVIVHNPEAVNSKVEGNPDAPILLLLAGSSESGKSTMGKMAVETDLASRIKYLNISAKILMNGSKSNEIIDVLSVLEQEGNEVPFAEFLDVFIDEIIEVVSTRGGVAVVETLKHPGLVYALQNSSRVRAFSVFVDADLNKRVERESIKAGATFEETMEAVLKKDKAKGSLGLEEIRDGADLTMINNGTYEEYCHYSACLLEYLSLHSNIPNSQKSIQVS
jgi:hypothetical protein